MPAASRLAAILLALSPTHTEIQRQNNRIDQQVAADRFIGKRAAYHYYYSVQ